MCDNTDYEINKFCRFCDNTLVDAIKLGNSFPLAGGFMRSKEEFENEKTYPLTLAFCEKCVLLQCKEVIRADTLFKKGYFYYSSMIPMLRNHFTNYAEHLSTLYKDPTAVSVLEMGCNDGVFLRPLREKGFKVVGVDPSNTVQKCIDDGFKIYNTYFNEITADKILNENGKFDVFVSSNSFAHIDNMKSVMNGVKKILKPGGLAIIEVHYSKTILDELQFDFIYHEHMSYYNVTSFSRIANLYEMSLENVEMLNVHGTSIRVYLRNAKDVPVSDNIQAIINDEKALCDMEVYKTFNERLVNWKHEITQLLNTFKGKKLYGYGSSGRSNIILRYLDLKLDEIIDDAESKIGTYTPIYHLCIKSSQEIAQNPPDGIIILSWAYKEDIIKKLDSFYKGTYIIPLPAIKVLKSTEQ